MIVAHSTPVYLIVERSTHLEGVCRTGAGATISDRAAGGYGHSDRPRGGSRDVRDA
jgi:hypothetical protein